MLRHDLEEIRRRLNELGLPGTVLAAKTGHNARTVQDYLSKPGRDIPADFIAKLEDAGVASARWLLLEEGEPAVAHPELQGKRLRVIGKIAEGKLDPGTLAEIEKLATLRPRTPRTDVEARRMERLRESGPSLASQHDEPQERSKGPEGGQRKGLQRKSGGTGRRKPLPPTPESE